MIYKLLRALLRHALAIFFRRLEVEGLDDVPAEGPLLIAANHPNTLIDVLLVATRLERKVGFVAKAPLFDIPVLGRVFRFFGAIPVYRRQDGAVGDDAKAANSKALQACVDHVAQGGAILIFPEGVSQSTPRLQKLKTGLARIALAAEAQVPGQVVVAPVGLVYEDPETFRSRARVTFATPIRVAPFASIGRSAGDPFVGVRALTETVRQTLLPELVHIDDPELDALATRIDALYGRAVKDDVGGRLAASAALTHALNAFASKQPGRVASLKAELTAYDAALLDAGVDDDVVRDPPRPPSLLADAGLALGAPLALWGALNHLILYQIPRAVLRFVPSDPVETSTTKLVTGLLGFVATYAVQGTLLFQFAADSPGFQSAFQSPWPPTLIYLGTLPLTGVIALLWLEGLKVRKVRAAALERRQSLGPERLTDLVSKRQRILEMLDAARADYLAGQLDPADAEADHPW